MREGNMDFDEVQTNENGVAKYCKVWGFIFIGGPLGGDYPWLHLCNSGIFVLSQLSLPFLALPSAGPPSHLGPSGGRSRRPLQKETFRTSREVLIQVWREVSFPPFHFSIAEGRGFFLILPASHLTLFPSLRLPVFSLWPCSWSQSLNRFLFFWFFCIPSSVLSAHFLIHYPFSHAWLP